MEKEYKVVDERPVRERLTDERAPGGQWCKFGQEGKSERMRMCGRGGRGGEEWEEAEKLMTVEDCRLLRWTATQRRTQQSTRSARAWCVVREEQRKKGTVWKKEVARQNVAAREHVLKALSSISENRWCEIRRRAGDVWAKKESGGERAVAKEEGARCEGRCEGVEGMQ